MNTEDKSIITLGGRVSSDPTYRQVGSNYTELLEFTIVIGKKGFKRRLDPDTNEVKHASEDRWDYFNIKAWKQVAIDNSDLEVGERVELDCELSGRSWEDTNGVKRYATDIIAKNIKRLSRHEVIDAKDLPS